MDAGHVFYCATEADGNCQLSGINHFYNLCEQDGVVLSKQSYDLNGRRGIVGISWSAVGLLLR